MADELASVQAWYENQIRFSMAQALWAFAYGSWAQQDIYNRDPDAADTVLRWYEDNFTPTGIGDMPVSAELWVTLSPPTPLAAEHCSQQVAKAIATAEGFDGTVFPLATLYAMVMEIDTGEPFEWVAYKEPDRPEPELLFDSASGTSIPRRFAEEMKRDAVAGVDEETWDILAQGDIDENEWYYEAWDGVLDHAVITDSDGTKYRLAVNDNGDVFLVPEGMEWDEETEWYRWPAPEPPPGTEFGFALIKMCLGAGSWFDDHKSKRGNAEWVPNLPRVKVEYDEEDLTWEIRPRGSQFATVGLESATRSVRVYFERYEPAEEGEEISEPTRGEQDTIDISDITNVVDDDSLAEVTAERIANYSGNVEASSTSFHKGVWYTAIDPDIDYTDGSQTTYSFHLDGYTEEEEREVFKLLTRRR